MNSPVMFRVTLWRYAFLGLFVVTSMSYGQEAQQVAPIVKTTIKKPFTMDQVIDEGVAKMAVPEMRPEMVGVKMLISSPSEKAREHVKAGFALVHAQWDFEAYRHFCVALAEDPDCLMAYCGVTLALAKPYNEYAKYRRAAVSRMLDLVDADKAGMKLGKAERFPAVEKGFVMATATLVSASPRAAGIMFGELGEKFPQLIQARLLFVFLTRGGYDVLGTPSAEQKWAIKKTQELLREHPTNPMVLGFWLSLIAEAPRASMNIKKDILPYARYLAKKCPDVPSWQHALGHYEWRAGNYLLAEKAFTKAVDLYSGWMKREGVGVNDCEGYIRAQCYLANTLYQRGNYLAAMKVAKEISAIKPDPDRPVSPGNQILFWRAYTLPARLYMAHGADGDMDLALKSFPSKKVLKHYVEHPKNPTLAGVYMEALSAYMGCRKAINDKAMESAGTLHKKTFRRYIIKMAKVAEGAKRSADYSHYFNAGSSLAIYDMELAGLVALNGMKDMRMTASNWFRSARDKQGMPSMMMPPLVLTPMENRLAEYYLSAGKNQDALDAYTAGEQRYPNNVASMLGIKRSLELLGRNDAAAVVQKQIDIVKNTK
jgi:tetratricopeptide (TPR) repeat protein